MPGGVPAAGDPGDPAAGAPGASPAAGVRRAWESPAHGGAALFGREPGFFGREPAQRSGRGSFDGLLDAVYREEFGNLSVGSKPRDWARVNAATASSSAG